jgi:hypothetical protein
MVTGGMIGEFVDGHTDQRRDQPVPCLVATLAETERHGLGEGGRGTDRAAAGKQGTIPDHKQVAVAERIMHD